ncbi:hypothetical protein RND81_02G100200 [Saponaria officinalis]|uniref:non-specific serine/threonine protein kinase n=1 Tax=Saponaria officinalis TaxID=3572 RepID=A0AAW1ML33_SAPOF
MKIMRLTLQLLVIFLHVFTTVSSYNSDDFVTQALACRGCKFYMRVSVGGVPIQVGAPPETSSSGKAPNVGAVVGLTLLLVLILVVGFVYVYRNRRSPIPNPENTLQQQQQQHQLQLQLQQQQQQQQLLLQQQRRQQQQQQKPIGEEARQQENKEMIEVKVEGKGKEVDDLDKVTQSRKRGREENKQAFQDENNCGSEPKRGRELIGGKIWEVPKEVKEFEKKQVGEVVIEQENYSGLPKKYTYKYLMSMTNNFNRDNKIGGGGFGIVYKGTLKNGTLVAVKCLKYGGEINDFKNEVDALSEADHSNLVKLIGYCDEGIIRILVYEYMKNRSLDKWIFRSSSKHQRSLTWPQLKNVIKGIAQGLVYLHDQCEKRVLHRDLKPPNVLLDDNKNAKLCDFGLAKLLNKDQNSTSAPWVGTEWYVAPEVKKGRISDKVDVYSFGVVMLEVMFGKIYPNLVTRDRINNTEEVKLDYLINNLSDDMKKDGKEIETYGMLAKVCLREKPGDRLPMSLVLAVIHDIEAKFNGQKPEDT